jgi:predicted Zn-dependent peptidase
VNTPDTAGALQEIFSELQRLSGTAPDDEELQRVKNYRAGHFLMGASSREGLIGQVAFVDQHDLGPDWLPTYLQRLQSITPEAVRAAAAQFDPKTMTVVVAGDLSKIKSGITGIEALQGASFH